MKKLFVVLMTMLLLAIIACSSKNSSAMEILPLVVEVLEIVVELFK